MTSTFFVSGLKRARKSNGGKFEQVNREAEAGPKEQIEWNKIIADVAVILKKLPHEIAHGLSLYQAMEVKNANHRLQQFEGAIHGIKIPDVGDDRPRTADGKRICTEEELNELIGMLN